MKQQLHIYFYVDLHLRDLEKRRELFSVFFSFKGNKTPAFQAFFGLFTTKLIYLFYYYFLI